MLAACPPSLGRTCAGSVPARFPAPRAGDPVRGDNFLTCFIYSKKHILKPVCYATFNNKSAVGKVILYFVL